ncbi:MAG: citryl-CoA lyase [Gammaproteobacteria bacterium]|nr:citryl-CoA lyase [Gammaproteobacteria bacterium]
MNSADSKTRATTAICGYDADNIMIRKKNLVDDLIGRYSFTQLLLLQALGEEPTPMQCQIVDSVLVTIMEHGLVPSAVATRLTHYGAPESFQGAVVAGLLGVGDRYAGTAGECGAILERIVSAKQEDRRKRAVAEIRAYREIRRPVPGFGHPIHHDTDRRVSRLIEVSTNAGAKGEFIAAMHLLEASLQEVIGKPLVTNISAAIGAVLGEAGVPSQLMRGIVLTARCAGLVGHLYEEMNNPAAHDMWVAAQSAVDYAG